VRLKYEKVIHHAIVNNLFGFGYTKKSCNAQGSSKYYLFVTAPQLSGCCPPYGYHFTSPYALILAIKLFKSFSSGCVKA